MAAQPPYPHPGPSNYFQHHPAPPHFAYGSHSPAPPPGPAQYQYQYPIPPMNGHPHPIHSPSSPQINSQGRAFPPSRGGPSYQNYHPHPQSSHHHHYSYSQHSSHSPGPYPPPPAQPPHPHGKYPHPHAQPVPYSPNYPVHPSTSYAPAWQSQQPLSPLPKQLSMPPPVSAPPFQPSSQLLQREESIPSFPTDSTPTPDTEHITSDSSSSQPTENPEHTPEMPSPSLPHVSRTSTSPTTTSLNTSPPRRLPSRSSEYVIWSRRPTNPSSAPGIIISPRARPPHDVVQKALDLPSPPASPVPSQDAIREQVTPTPPDHVDAPSSAATVTTPPTSSEPNTSIPTSPVSTNTSVSVAGSPSRDKPSQPTEQERVATPNAEEKPLPSSQPTEPIAASEPPVSPPISSVPKPSFASLFRAGGATPSKPNALPTSSIVGFSIPASVLSSTSQAPPVPVGKKPQLQALLSSAPSGPPLMKIRPRGLVNTGNMCFANAVMQALNYCPPFWRLFHELGKFVGESSEEDVNEGKAPLVDATVRFLREFLPKQANPTTPAEGKGKGKGKGIERYSTYSLDEDEEMMSSFIPTYVYDVLKGKKRFDHMRGGHQEDAEEFLGFYLDTLEEELLSMSSALTTAPANGPVSSTAPNSNAAQDDGQWLEVGKRNRTAFTRTTKTTESPITRMFGGKFRSTLRVPHQKDSVIVEDWRSLRLDIQREQIRTIKDALAYISSPQSVQVTSVTRPGATLDATQLVQIDALPPILILHLKRFLYDANAGGVAKVGKQVSFTPELEIGSDVMAPGKKMHSTRYKLFGVVYHHGLSASGGHYTIDVLHPNIDSSPTKPREGWIRIDDELISDVRPDDVFGIPERDDRCAYLLFYRRVGSSSARTP